MVIGIAVVPTFSDSIDGIDCLPECQVVDFQYNGYGKLFCDFLIDTSCCILNGRNIIQNDFTYLSKRGSSVVDYTVIPYELMDSFDSFKVIRVTSLSQSIDATGKYDLRTILPDHSLLT